MRCPPAVERPYLGRGTVAKAHVVHFEAPKRIVGQHLFPSFSTTSGSCATGPGAFYARHTPGGSDSCKATKLFLLD